MRDHWQEFGYATVIGLAAVFSTTAMGRVCFGFAAAVIAVVALYSIWEDSHRP